MSPPDGGRDPTSRPEGPELGSRRELGGSSLYSEAVDWLTRHGERTGNALVYSPAYMATIAMTEIAIAMVLLSLPANVAPVVTGLVAFAVYAGDRLVDVGADEIRNPDRAAFVRRYESELAVLGAVAYGLAVALSVLGGPAALAIALFPGVFWALYSLEWIPEALRFRRLKEILVVNSTVVALAWAVTLTFLPLAFTRAAITPTAGFVFAYFFLRSFVDTEIPNVRDVEEDRDAGVPTLPVVFGVDWTRRGLYGLDLLTAAVVGYAALGGFLAASPATALLAGVAYSLGVTSLVGRIENERLVAIAAEFEYVVVGVALVPVVYGA